MRTDSRPLILIVDDEPTSIHALFAILQSDYVVCMATSGDDALAFCRDRTPDLILLDLSMPGMDGLEVCRRIKRDEATRHVPIIVVTASDSPAEEAHAFDEGAVDFISKPFHERIVKARVNAQITLKIQADSLRSLAVQLARARDEALHTASAKATFLATMSHEIRTPLNGILGLTALVLDGALTAEQREQLSLIADAGRSLLAIINDILDLSKAEAGKIALEAIALSPAAVVGAAVSLVREGARAKGLALDVSIANDVPPWVTGDPTRLRQVLFNLLGNALKFTERGRVIVTVRRETSAAGNMLRYAVIDTGIGIAPENQHLLFQSFSQVDRSDTRRYGGTGLGLAIARQLTTLMGGAIRVTSDIGSGSEFWFTTPLVPAAAPASAAATGGRSAQVAARRILVADDNVVNQLVARGLLEKDGHEVVVVDDGLAAVGAVQERAFDLVLMDMQMPTMNGIEATRRIRSLAGAVANIPIVALSANVMADHVVLCREAGMNAHLAKPVDPVSLRRIVATWGAAVDPLPCRAVRPRGFERPAHPVRRAATLDVAKLLEIFADDRYAIASLLDEARRSIRGDMRRLEERMHARDAAGTIATAHHLKGTCVELHACRAGALASRIERTPATAFWSFVPALLDELREAISALDAEIAAFSAQDAITAGQEALGTTRQT